MFRKRTKELKELEEKIEELENKIEELEENEEPQVDYDYIKSNVARMVQDSISFLDDSIESVVERKTIAAVNEQLDRRLPEIKDKLLIEVVKASIGLNRNSDNEKEKEKNE